MSKFPQVSRFFVPRKQLIGQYRNFSSIIPSSRVIGRNTNKNLILLQKNKNLSSFISYHYFSTNSSKELLKHKHKKGKWVRFLVRIVAYGILFTSALVFYASGDLYQPQYSLVFLGRKKNYEKQVDEETGAPISKMIFRAFEAIFGGMFVSLFPVVKPYLDPTAPGQSLIHEFPDCIVGYVYLAVAEFTLGNVRHCKDAINLARQVAEFHPELNKNLLWLIPTDDELKDIMKPIWTERVKDTIWTLTTPFKTGNQPVAEITTTIVRRQDGTVLVINPGQLTPEQVDKINSLGKVTALITPVAGHGIGITLCSSKYWPQAQIWGTQPTTKHEHPELKWNGFVTNDNSHPFAPDLQNIQLQSSQADTIFYHSASKTLIGPTDLVSSVSQKTSWFLRVYGFSTGMYHGPKRTNPTGAQHYLYLIGGNNEEFRKSLQKLLDLDFQRMILGHTGYFEGEPAKNVLYNTYPFLLNKDEQGKYEYSPSLKDRLCLPIAWFFHSKLSTILWCTTKANILNTTKKS